MPTEALVERPAGHDLQGPRDVLGQHRRQPDRNLLEGPRKVGIVFVREAGHQARRQEHCHRLGQGELQGRQEALLGDTPASLVAPERDLHLALQRLKIPVDRPSRHPDGRGDLFRSGTLLAALFEKSELAVIAACAIPLCVSSLANVHAGFPVRSPAAR